MLTFRLATKEDAKLYFDWANDPEVRKQSHNTDLVLWKTHLKWFNKKVESDSLLLVFFDGSTPVGQVRIDDGLISFTVDSKFRGKGFGTAILETVKTLVSKKFNRITAEVKKDNIPSIKAFERAGFKLQSEIESHGVKCNMYVLE